MKGYIEIEMTVNEQIAFLESSERETFGLHLNQYLVLRDKDSSEVINKLKLIKDNRYKAVAWKPIRFPRNNVPDTYPKNLQQELAMDMLQDINTPIKLLTGRYGTGKDFLALSYYLQLVDRGKLDRLIWLRNPVPTKHVEKTGILPGDVMSKLGGFAMIIADFLGSEDEMLNWMARDMIRVEPLDSIRGRSFNNSVLYCTEAQNLTEEHIALLIARVGEGSEIFFNGDIKQTDKVAFDSNSGIRAMLKKFPGNKEYGDMFGHVHLEIVERSRVARSASLFEKD